MSHDDHPDLQRIAEAVADRTPVDWSEDLSPEFRDIMKNFQALDLIGVVLGSSTLREGTEEEKMAIGHGENRHSPPAEPAVWFISASMPRSEKGSEVSSLTIPGSKDVASSSGAGI
jgi:hypothetical protein